MTWQRALVTLAVFLALARFLSVILVPLSAMSPSLLLVMARPTGEVIALSVANAPLGHGFAVAALSFSSRFALDLVVFSAARYATEHVPKRWKPKLRSVHRRIPTKWLLAMVIFYSVTPLVVTLALSNAKTRIATFCLALNSTLVVTAYILLSRIVPTEVAALAHVITDNRVSLTAGLILGVIIALAGYWHARQGK
jgi:hypothetical protein